MTIQEKLASVAKDLETLDTVIQGYKKTPALQGFYSANFLKGKRNFVDFGDEVRANSGWLLSSSKWKLTDKEEIDELRQAITILNEDVSLLKETKGVASDTVGTCEKVLKQLKEIEGLMGAESKPESKSPRR